MTRGSGRVTGRVAGLVIAVLAALAGSLVVAAPANAVTQGGACNAFTGAYQLQDAKGTKAAYTDSSVTVPACGPLPGSGDGQPHVYAYKGARWTGGYQCVEFSERFIYYKYGLTAPDVYMFGAQLVDQYMSIYSAKFEARSSEDKKPLAQGDVLSFAHKSFADKGGHTAVVQSSSIDANGNGTVTIVEQNSSPGGMRPLTVKNWGIQATGYDVKNIKWLHYKSSPTPPPAGGGSGGGAGSKKLDVVFAIDTTGSMAPYIASVVRAASTIVSTLDAAHADYRVGLVDYKDADGCGDYASVKDLDFSTSKAAIQDALSALTGKVSGGCDIPEDVYSGIHQALGFPWRPGVSKSVIFMGDAPGHDPEPHSGLTLATIKAEAYAVDPAQVYAVMVGVDPEAHSFDQALADATDGKTFDATSDPDAAGQAFVAAIDAILGTAQPTQTTVTPSASRVPAGAPVTLSATVTPAVDGGSVAFVSDGEPIVGCQGAPVDAQGKASCTTVFNTAATHSITAVYSGDSTFADSTSTAVPLTVVGTCLSGQVGAVSVPRGGTLCLGPDAVVRGPVSVANGGMLFVYGATIHGAVSATSPARVVLCGSTVDGALSVVGATGLVTVGDLDGNPSCGGNTLSSGVNLANDRGGVQASDNVVRGSMSVTGAGGTLPPPDTGATDVQFNDVRPR